MIEKVTLHLTKESKLISADGHQCDDLNPKAMLLHAGAKCAALTVMYILGKEKIVPKRLEISLSGELSTHTVQAGSIFNSFHVFYNIECGTMDDQVKVSHAVTLANEKYCGMLQMLRKIAPVTHEIAVVSTTPAHAKV